MAELEALPTRAELENDDIVYVKTSEGVDSKTSFSALKAKILEGVPSPSINQTNTPLSLTLSLPKSGDITSGRGIVLAYEDGELKAKQVGSATTTETVRDETDFPDLHIDLFDYEAMIDGSNKSVIRSVGETNNTSSGQLIKLSDNVFVFGMDVRSLEYRKAGASQSGGSGDYLPDAETDVRPTSSQQGSGRTNRYGLHTIALWKITRTPASGGTPASWTIADPKFLVHQEINKSDGESHLRAQYNQSVVTNGFFLTRLSDDYVGVYYYGENSEYTINDTTFQTTSVSGSSDSNYWGCMIYDVTNDKYTWKDTGTAYSNSFFLDDLLLRSERQNSSYPFPLTGISASGGSLKLAGFCSNSTLSSNRINNSRDSDGKSLTSQAAAYIYSCTMTANTNGSYSYVTPALSRDGVYRLQSGISPITAGAMYYDPVSRYIGIVGSGGNARSTSISYNAKVRLTESLDNFERTYNSTNLNISTPANDVETWSLLYDSDAEYSFEADRGLDSAYEGEEVIRIQSASTSSAIRTRQWTRRESQWIRISNYTDEYTDADRTFGGAFGSTSYDKWPFCPFGLIGFNSRLTTAATGGSYDYKDAGYRISFVRLGSSVFNSFGKEKAAGIATGDTSGANVTVYLFRYGSVIQGLSGIVTNQRYYMDNAGMLTSDAVDSSNNANQLIGIGFDSQSIIPIQTG